MNKEQLKRLILKNKVYKKTTTDFAKQHVTFTGTVYYTDDGKSIILLFKHNDRKGKKSLPYSLLYINENSYQDITTKGFADFWVKVTESVPHKKTTIVI